MTKPLHESALTLAEATTSTNTSGLLEVEFITPGWGSSGYYSREVVEAAAPLFTVGTHMYFDHPSSAENIDRPERSVRDLAAVIESAGTVDLTTGGIRGQVRPLKAYSELLTDEAFAKNVGLSIRGSATDITIGEAEGRTGPIIEALADVASVDFVTRAGRGGSVLSVLESANLLEATASDRLSQLREIIRAKYRGRGVWAWVQDMDAETTTFAFEVNTDDGPSITYEQGYAVGANDVDVTLTGEPVEVRRVTTYVPVTRLDSTNPTTEETLEVTMGNIQIEESEHRSLVEKAGRVDALETENATKDQRIKQFEEAEARRGRLTKATTIIGARAQEAGVEFTPREVKGLLADITLTEAGDLDEAAFTTLVDEDATAKAQGNGAGKVRGFGSETSPVGEADTTITDAENAVAEAFGRTPAANQIKEA